IHMDIKHLFDPSKDIYRTIEKVITYGAAQKHRLKAEISEYEVTTSLEEQLERLLTSMQAAMELGGENEVGVLLLDLASEEVAGATMEEVSTVLYYKVLQWAGYSRNLKVAAFERRLKKD